MQLTCFCVCLRMIQSCLRYNTFQMLVLYMVLKTAVCILNGIDYFECTDCNSSCMLSCCHACMMQLAICLRYFMYACNLQHF